MDIEYNLLEDDDDLEVLDLVNFGIPREFHPGLS
jgi:hypothetical protein